jgi:hypothetical protein
VLWLLLLLFNLLPAQSQALYQRAIPFHILPSHILEKALAATHQAEKPSPGRVVGGVLFQVRGQVLDPRRKNGDLYLRRAGVDLTAAIIRDDLGFSS